RRAELTVFLEFGGLQDDLIQGGLGQGEIGFACSLHQQAAIDEVIERGVAQQAVVDERSVEIPAELLHQLTPLHFHREAQLRKADFFAVDLRGGLLVAGVVENGLETSEREQDDDQTDEGLRDPAL